MEITQLAVTARDMSGILLFGWMLVTFTNRSWRHSGLVDRTLASDAECRVFEAMFRHSCFELKFFTEFRMCHLDAIIMLFVHMLSDSAPYNLKCSLRKCPSFSTELFEMLWKRSRDICKFCLEMVRARIFKCPNASLANLFRIVRLQVEAI